MFLQVPSSGPKEQSTAGLHNLPWNVASQTRSVRLVLSAQDLVGKAMKEYEDGVDLILNLYRFHAHCHHEEVWLNSNWSGKLKTVFVLPLTRLTLDVSDAFAPNGVFLDLSYQLAFRFRYGVPRELVIIASNEQLAEEVRHTIKISNDPGFWSL